MRTDQISQLIPLLLWFLALFMVGSATLVSGIVCLVLKGQARTKAIDVFLVLSTVAIAVGLVVNVLPHDAVSPMSKISSRQKAIHDAELYGNRLTEYVYIAKLPQPFILLAGVEGNPKLEEALTSVEEYVKKQLNKYPGNPDLTGMLAILKHENKEDVSKLFDDDVDENEKVSNELLDSLQILYAADKGKITPNVGRILEKKLPNGWYRDAALQFFYKTTNSPSLEPFLRDREKLANEWRQKLKIIYVLNSVFCCIGFITVFRFFFARKEQAVSTASSLEPRYFPFRNWYGCALAYFYTSLVTSVAIGFCFGLWSAITHSNWPLSSMVLVIYGISAFISVLLFLVCVDFFIRKFAGIKSWGALLAERSLQDREFIVSVFGGFCSMVAILALVRIILCAIPGISATPNNAVQNQMVDALTASNSPVIFCLIVFICILGPLVEEILCRGLMYPWMRHKVGILWGTVATSLAFGIAHFDLGGLGYYFAMGVTLNLLFERKRNLLLNFATHAVWNIWVVLWMVAIVIR